MIVIGVTGGIASGKSLVARELGRRGATVIDADRVGHAVLRLGEVRRALHARWGDAVFDTRDGGPGGTVDRTAIARRVFAAPPDGPRDLAYLEQLTHPRISECITRRLARWRQTPAVKVAVLDAPVLYKAGWEQHCDQILFVDAPPEVRAARVARRGWSRDEFEARQARQTSLEYQRSRADVVIDNGGALEATIRQVDAYWRALAEAGV